MGTQVAEMVNWRCKHKSAKSDVKGGENTDGY